MKVRGQVQGYVRVFLVLSAFAVVGCSSTRPIYNVDNYYFPSENVDKLSQKALDQIAVAAGSDLGWEIVANTPGHLVGFKRVDALSARIKLDINADTMAIRYRSSKNLSAGDGKIEPDYNHWIKQLKYDISDAVVLAADED